MEPIHQIAIPVFLAAVYAVVENNDSTVLLHFCSAARLTTWNRYIRHIR
jgi:hypothetical protein